MWSKRPKVSPGDRKLRCEVLVKRDGISVKCQRPARTYACEKTGFALGLSNCCIAHARRFERLGFTLTFLDGRRARNGVRKVA